MSYKQSVLQRVATLDQRAQERLALWQSIADSFEAAGADGVQEELAGRMSDIRRKFQALLTELEAML